MNSPDSEVIYYAKFNRQSFSGKKCWNLANAFEIYTNNEVIYNAQILNIENRKSQRSKILRQVSKFNRQSFSRKKCWNPANAFEIYTNNEEIYNAQVLNVIENRKRHLSNILRWSSKSKRKCWNLSILIAK